MTLPSLAPWMRALLATLFGLYIVEVTARNYLHWQVDSLSWRPLKLGFEPLQLLTHPWVQGPGRGGAWGALMALLVLWFFLPAVSRLLPRKEALTALGVAAATGIALALLGDFALGFDRLYGGATGYSPWITAMIALFGLALPTGVVQLFFVLPVQGRVIAWGSLGVSALMLFAEPSLATAEQLGAVLGIFGWWFGVGPGARRRRMNKRAKVLERDLRGWKVLDGGRADETVH